MSGIVGILNLDGALVDPAALEAFLGRLAHRGPDGRGTWHAGPFGLGQALLATTPHALAVPHHDPETGLTVVLDGRIDAREELDAALEARGHAPRHPSDVERVLRAYAAWGTECPIRLLGDYAFLVWDARRRELFGARDALGIKPFTYHHAPGKRLLVASELQAILRVPGVPWEVDEGFVGELLAWAPTSVEATVWASVRRLPPASALHVKASGALRTWRYWEPDLTYEAPGTEDELRDHLRATLEAAVRDRLRGTDPVGVSLSGGVDSSSIVGLAVAVGAGDRLRLFTSSFAGEVEADEVEFARDVANFHRLPLEEVAPHVQSLAEAEAEAARTLDLPTFPSTASIGALLGRAHGAGLRVLLGGLGGDEWLSGSGYWVADSIRGGHIREAASRLWVGATIWGWRATLRHLRDFGLHPLARDLLPSSAWGALRVLRRQVRGDPLPWLDKAWRARIALETRLSRTPGRAHDSSYVRADLWAGEGHRAICLEVQERFYAWNQLEAPQPLHDRRVVSLGIALPACLRHRGVVSKYLMRMALGAHLPASVRERTDKARFGHTFEALTAQQPSTQRLGGALPKGWLAHACLIPDGTPVWVPWAILAIDVWFRTVRPV